MKTAIVYYSMSGNTRYAAEKMASLLNADLVPLTPKKAYPDSGFKKFSFPGTRVLPTGDHPDRPQGQTVQRKRKQDRRVLRRYAVKPAASQIKKQEKHTLPLLLFLIKSVVFQKFEQHAGGKMGRMSLEGSIGFRSGPICQVGDGPHHQEGHSGRLGHLGDSPALHLAGQRIK